jgi:hypothetical protein
MMPDDYRRGFRAVYYAVIVAIAVLLIALGYSLH